MLVEEVDAPSASDALLEEIALVDLEALEELRAGQPSPSLESKLRRYRNPGAAIRRRWLARVDGEPAGLAVFVEHGPAFFFGEVRVRPSYRRRGIGTALFEHVLAAARERGAPSFFGDHGTEAGAAFARSVGAVDSQREVKSLLRLRDADLAEPAPPAGIELLTFTGAAPDELVESYVRARDALNDAPTPDGAEFPEWTVELQRDDERSVEARGVTDYVTVALERGEVLAFTCVRVGPSPAPFAATEDTATLPAARGRGLATLVKLENLRTVRTARPDVELVGTMNAERNAVMRAVNTKIGFVPSLTLTSTVVTP